MFDPASRATWTGTLAARLYQRSLWLERPALRAAVSLARATPADRLLDVGTGTGAFLAMLASSPNRPERAVGLDRSRSMLTAAPPLPKGWAIVEGDARALPYSITASTWSRSAICCTSWSGRVGCASFEKRAAWPDLKRAS